MQDKNSYKREGKPLPYGCYFYQCAGDQWSPESPLVVFSMFAHPKRPPCVKGAGAERLRDCRSLEIAQKKKKQKENAVKEMRKGGFLKKAPFKSSKNFRTLSPVIRRAHPKLRTSLFAPPQGGAGCSACAPKVTRQPVSPRRKAVSAKQSQKLFGDRRRDCPPFRQPFYFSFAIMRGR